MARRKIIAGNWKMNMTPTEALALVETLKPLVATDEADVVFCVPAIDLIPVVEAVKGTNIAVGAENMYFEEKGAYTGEISPNMLTDAGVKYVIIGHSERRTHLKEDNYLIRKKLSLCFDYDVVPILCIGEILGEKERRMEVLKEQIDLVLQGLKLKEIVIAYEPIWSIGTGSIPTNKEIQSTIHWIKEYMRNHYLIECKTIYGGSVNQENIESLNQIEEIDGYLIGRASLKIEELKRIVEILEV